MNISNYLRSKLLDHIVGGAAYVAPTSLFFALYTSAPNENGGGTEVSGNGYARSVQANSLTIFPAASNGAKSNGAQIAFTFATAPWGTVTHIGVFDTATSGNLLFF